MDPSPTPRPHRAIDDSSRHTLPAWFLSALKDITGRGVADVRSNLPFLEKLKDTLPAASRNATLHHIPGTVCARWLAYPEKPMHIHDKNATVFAVDGGVVYATCSTGAHKITESSVKVVNMYSRANEDGSVQPVESVTGKCVHWAMIDEETMHLIVEIGQCFVSCSCQLKNAIIALFALLILHIDIAYNSQLQ